MRSHSSPPRTRASRRLPVVPLVALVTTFLLQSVQLLVMQVRGARHGMGLSEVMMQWDSQWMTLISRHGYSGFAMGDAGVPGGEPIEWQSVAFFPGYPLLVRLVAAPVRGLTGAEVTTAAAVLVSVIACVVMVWGLGRLATDVLWPAVTGKDATSPVTAGALTLAAGVLALGAPMSVVYVMPYSESLYTALAVWAVLMMLRRRYLTAGVLVFFAGLTRLTAAVLVLTLAVAAVVELWCWWRRRRGGSDAAGTRAAGQGAVGQYAAGQWFTGQPAARLVRACAAPVLGVLGIAAYIVWANGKAEGVGGYFAAQDRGWHSGFDYGAATWHWLTTESLNLFSRGDHDGTMPGYAISGWSMILVALLCVASLWPLLTRRIPWQLWLPAVAVAGMTLGADGIMHSRPRLLLIPVLFLLLPLVVSGLAAVRDRLGRRPWLASVPVVLGAVWCVVGFWVSGEMLVDFAYAI